MLRNADICCADAQRRLRAELDQIAALLQPEAEYLEAEYA